MRSVYKFGGSSIKCAATIKEIAHLITACPNDALVVLSATHNSTNELEEIYKSSNYEKLLSDFFNKHQAIISELELDLSLEHLMTELELNLEKSKGEALLDAVYSIGERTSTLILSSYLEKLGHRHFHADARDYIRTNRDFNNAKVLFKNTKDKCSHLLGKSLVITQGFIARTLEGETTTLGREGSDYTAGVFAYCLNATNVTIWKDVPGVLNADPRVFEQTTLLHKISYKEAVEMAFYGASVIHPKTIQPLEQKNIPLYVRSFFDVNTQGTCVSEGKGIAPEIPCYIVKKNQILVAISAKDFSFMVEDNISDVFKKLHHYKLKVNLIQNSAISFSVCIEDKYQLFDDFYKDLEKEYTIKTYKNTALYTIRHFDDKAIETIKKRGKSIIRQINTETAQFVIQENL